MMAEHKHLEVSESGGVTALRVLDRELSDLELQDELHLELTGFVQSRQPQKLLVDFSAVTYCNTGVINTLITAKRQVEKYGGVFKLCGLTSHVHDAFVALNLIDTVFDVYATCNEARKAFGP